MNTSEIVGLLKQPHSELSSRLQKLASQQKELQAAWSEWERTLLDFEAANNRINKLLEADCK